MLDSVEYPDLEVLREDFRDLSEGQWSFLNALLTCQKDPRPWEDFYIFEDIVTALNYEVPDFTTLEPPDAEQLWHGIYLMHQIIPRLPFSFEVRTYAKRVFNDHGIYFYPELIDSSEDNKVVLKQIKEKAESGPFPLGDNNVLDIQTSHYMALDLYHKIEMGKNVDWLARSLENV